MNDNLDNNLYSNFEDDLPVLESISAMPTAQKYAIYMIFVSILFMIAPLFIESLMGCWR